MRSMLGQLIRTGAVCGMLMIMNPFTSMASIGPGFTAGTYVATITSESVNINRNMDSTDDSPGREYIRGIRGFRQWMDEGAGE